jgi:hypothetical protein
LKKKVMSSNDAAIEEASREVGVSFDALQRWRAEALTKRAPVP